MLGNLHPTRPIECDRTNEKPKLMVLDTMNFWMDNAWDELNEGD